MVSDEEEAHKLLEEFSIDELVDAALADNVDIQDFYCRKNDDPLDPKNFLNNLLYSRSCNINSSSTVLQELLPCEKKVVARQKQVIEEFDENGQWRSVVIDDEDDDDDGDSYITSLVNDTNNKATKIDDAGVVKGFSRCRSEKMSRLRGGGKTGVQKPRGSREELFRRKSTADAADDCAASYFPGTTQLKNVSPLLLSHYCSTVNRGLAKTLPCNNTSDEARKSNTYCCCIACAVRSDMYRCQCNRCAVFRDRRLRDGTFGALETFVNQALDDTYTQASGFASKLQRDLWVNARLSDAVQSFTDGGHARCWYEVGAIGRRIAVCLTAFAKAHKTGTRKLQDVIYGIRKTDFLIMDKRPVSDSKLVEKEAIDSFKRMAEAVGIQLTGEELAAVEISSTAKRNAAAAWIRRYAQLHGDLMPDGDNEWHLDPVDTMELYREYAAEVVRDMKEIPLKKSEFFKTWQTFCSNITIRQFKNVTGKCATCANFSEMRKQSISVEARSEIVACWLFHRATFAKERSAYHDRRLLATSQGNECRYWSLIGDGMQQVLYYTSRIMMMALLYCCY